MHWLSLVFIFGCLTAIHTAAVQNPSVRKATAALKGVWVNELGSTLNITGVYGPTFQIKGHYRSPSGTAGDLHSLNGVFNLLPMVSGKHNVVVLSFTVHWGKIGSVTSWSGFYDAEGSGQIIGQWLLVRPVERYIWEHILTGQDRFTKQ